MKFEVSQADFAEALGAMNRIAMRQVENTKVIRIEKVHDGRIRLIGTNLTMSLRYDIPASNVEGDAVNISLSLFPIVQKLNGVIEFDENKIRCGKSSFKIDKWAEQMPVNFEIKEAEESGFPDIAESLKEDMSGELDNLTAQYEEQRMKEVEAIRAKYSKKESY